MKVNVDKVLLERAAELAGITDYAMLVKLGLEMVIAQESARRLAALGGTEKTLRRIPRR